MRNVGKQGLAWQRTRRKWFKLHPPNHQNYYECYLCGRWVLASDITLDHVIPRSNAFNYAVRHDFDNLKPCCECCNSKKGSRKLDDLDIM